MLNKLVFQPPIYLEGYPSGEGGMVSLHWDWSRRCGRPGISGSHPLNATAADAKHVTPLTTCLHFRMLLEGVGTTPVENPCFMNEVYTVLNDLNSEKWYLQHFLVADTSTKWQFLFHRVCVCLLRTCCVPGGVLFPALTELTF